MKNFGGRALLLDRSDINTDEIIPARYLTELSKEALRPYLLEDLKLNGFDPARDIAGKNVIITRGNFGCGSSREHAPWALEVNGINLVIAESYARIFRQNMFNCGLLAVELAPDSIDWLFNAGKHNILIIDTDLDIMEFSIKIEGNRETERVAFSISGFDRDLIKEGGWVNFADKKY